jgi:hypothetical protein
MEEYKMLPLLPYTTAKILQAQVPAVKTSQGFVEKETSAGSFLIRLPTQSISVQITSGTLSVGDAVNVTFSSDQVKIEKIPQNEVSLPGSDFVHVRATVQDIVLKRIALFAADILKEKYISKDMMQRFEHIVAAVAKQPEAVSPEAKQVIEAMKAIVSANSLQSNVPDVAKKIAESIVRLVSVLENDIRKNSGTINLPLRQENGPAQGLYRFADLSTALSWLVIHKEVSDDIDWQELSKMYGTGPVTMKVFEPIPQSTFAAFISPDRVNAEMDHFIAVQLNASLWKSISSQDLASILSQKTFVPFDRLAQIDTLLSAIEQLQSVFSSQRKQPQHLLPQSIQQWLNVALDEKIPVQAVVARAPLNISSTLSQALANLSTGTIEALPQAETLNAFQPGITNTVLNGSDDLSTIIPEQMFKLGITLEKNLLTAAQNPAKPSFRL